MRTILTTIILLASVLAAPDAVRGDQVAHRAQLVEPTAVAPAAWDQQDPADSLYRAAVTVMNRGNYERAAELFRDIRTRHARSSYAPDAYYWEAFNRYRLDGTQELRRALELLQMQAERYADAATRANGDARSLQTRIQGILARRGDESSAEAIAIAARELAAVSAARSSEVVAEVAARNQQIAAEVQRAAAEAAAAGVGYSGRRGSEIPQECQEEAEPQLAALNALIHMSAERAVPVLRQVMQRRDECSVVLRRRAVFLIADKQTPETVDILLEVANQDPDVEVRRQAVFWLSEVEDSRAVDALERFLMESEDDQVRERAIFSLAQHEDPRAMQIVLSVARDGSMPVRLRERAVFWLAEEGSQEDIEGLKQMFGETEHDGLAERILFAVAQTDRPEDARWLLSVAQDANRSVELRSRAIFWAAEAGVSVQELTQLYGAIENLQLKERIIFGLSQSDEPGAIDGLIDIARNETNTQLRSRAIFWLGNSNDERAAEVLMEILANPGGGS